MELTYLVNFLHFFYKYLQERQIYSLMTKLDIGYHPLSLGALKPARNIWKWLFPVAVTSL